VKLSTPRTAATGNAPLDEALVAKEAAGVLNNCRPIEPKSGFSWRSHFVASTVTIASPASV
jgi:hypothetical protein